MELNLRGAGVRLGVRLRVQIGVQIGVRFGVRLGEYSGCASGRIRACDSGCIRGAFGRTFGVPSVNIRGAFEKGLISEASNILFNHDLKLAKKKKMASIQVDEVEIRECAFLVELISSILNLSYASLCDEAIWKSIKCEGCESNWPKRSSVHGILEQRRRCLVVLLRRSHSSCRSKQRMLEINIHPSWREYITELYKLPRTTVYLNFYQIDCFANHSDTKVNQILTVLQISLKIETRRKTWTKASTIVYPIEKLKIEEENMESL